MTAVDRALQTSTLVHMVVKHAHAVKKESSVFGSFANMTVSFALTYSHPLTSEIAVHKRHASAPKSSNESLKR